jgi:predicted CopG family antitoxin
MNTVNELQHDRTTISLSKKNYQKLKELGFTGESFGTVVSRLLQNVKEDKQ